MLVDNSPKSVPSANGLSGVNVPRAVYPVPLKPADSVGNASAKTIVNGEAARVRVFVNLVNALRVATVVKRSVPHRANGQHSVSGSKRFRNAIIAAGNGAMRSESGIHATVLNKETSTTNATIFALVMDGVM